jgi:hypothetical protein
MVGIFKKIHLMPKFQVRKYCSTTVQPPIFHLVQIQNWLFGPDLAQLWPNFGPTLVHLIHFVTGVGSSNLLYALTVVITFRNVLRVKVSGFYFQNWLFGPDLAQLWPNFGPFDPFCHWCRLK